MTKEIYFPDPKFLWKEILSVSLLGLLVISISVICGFLIGASRGGVAGAIFSIAIVVAANLLWIVPVLVWVPLYVKSLRYEVCEDEVIVHVGVITRSVKHVPYRTVTNLHVKRGPLDRFFGLGTLDIQTAGISGTSGAEESLVGLSNCELVYGLVAENVRQFRTAMSPAVAEEGSSIKAGEPWAALLHEVQQIHQILEIRQK